MKKTFLISILIASCLLANAQRIQRTTGDTLVIDHNNTLKTTPLSPTDYGTWRKISLYEDHVHWQTVTQTPWRVFAYGESVSKGKKCQYRICVTVVDSSGVSLPDAVVSYKNKTLHYDAHEMAYISAVKQKNNNPLILSVEYGGITRQVSINPNENYYYYPIPNRYHKNTLNENLSWLITDKNMYRPGDTIKWKVVGVNPQSGLKNGSPLSNEHFQLYLSNYSKDITLFSGNLNDRGVAFGELLVDTLKLVADRYYSIFCNFCPKGKPAVTLANTGFQYKDYELKDVVVSGKTDKQQYLWGDSVRISFNATDEKGDYLDNGSVKCHLYINSVNRIYGESLWYKNDLSDTLTAKIHQGVAEFVVPTDKWLKADFDFSVRWSFRSADGMERDGYLYMNYRRDSLPATPVAPDQSITINTRNTADSVGFSAIASLDPTTGKPRPFHWSIYRNAKLFASGVDTLLNWKKPESTNALFYCFISGEGINSASQSIKHGKYGLNVEVVQQNAVVPGSTDEITIRVTDNNGKPVPNADITALGYTKKLNRNISMPQDWMWNKKKYERQLSSLNGNDYEETGDSVIKDSWLVSLLKAESTQYWQLAHNNTDKVQFIRSRSGVNKPQVVPVLVRDGQVLPVSRLDIDLEPAWVTGTTNDRYVFVLKQGRSHQFTFYVGDTVYSCIVNNMNIKRGEKVWLSVPVSACKKSNLYNNNVLMQNDIESRRVSLSSHAVNGNAYINVEGNDSLIRRVSSNEVMNKNIGYQNYYNEMRLDGPAANFPFFFCGDKMVYYSADRMMIVQNKCSNDNINKLSKKQKKNYIVENSFPSLDDSICTTAELMNDWVSQVDNHRSMSELSSLSGKYNISTDILLLYCDNEERPVNILYRAVGDSVQYVANGNYRYNIRVLKDKRYEILFVYKNARTRVLMVDVHNDGNHVIKASLDSSMTIEHNAMTIALEDSLRHEYEKTMAFEHHFSPTSTYVLNDFYDGELDEAMVLSSGTGTRKAKPMMMKSVALESNSVVGYANADMVTMEEEVSYESADALPEPQEEEIIIRDNFNDVAFWQPDLVTDRNGEARFTITYPDDLTEWREAFVAIRGKQRGYAMSSVIARKDEVAKLKMPRFAVVGDSVSAIGTGVNYVTGTSAVDTLHAVAEGDSLCMQYVFGHDGERRCSPIYKQGMEARDANFYILEGDTSFTLKYNKTISSPMEVNVYTDIRETLLESVETLAKSDWCGSNDYLALRLQAMRMVADSDYTKTIDEIEKKLLANRLDNGLWCWYAKSVNSPSLWVTECVLSAFPDPASLKSPAMESTLGSLFIRYRNNKNWSMMFEVARLFDLLGDTLQRNLRLNDIPADSLAKYDSQALIEYQMMRGHDVKFDTMRHRTYTGGEYYTLNPKRRCCWFNPVYEQIETSLLAYKYYTKKGDVARCRAIKLWLMQYVRNRGRFGIVLSESLSLEIVKALWQDDKIGLKDLLYQLSINDKSAYELPYSTVLTNDARLEYKGKRTLYVSTEQRYWDENPDIVSNGMTIKSEYLPTSTNRATIKVDITLDADAEYLVVSIPIPAGCSYDDTSYSYTRGESHREEYKDRVNIFCETIGEGTHHFEVNLNERYPGTYTINPSEVRLIYFPAFNANNKKTKVTIR